MAFNLFYTILWTVEAVTTPRHGSQLYEPLKENIDRLIINVFIVLITLMEITKKVTSKVFIFFLVNPIDLYNTPLYGQ